MVVKWLQCVTGLTASVTSLLEHVFPTGLAKQPTNISKVDKLQSLRYNHELGKLGLETCKVILSPRIGGK